MLKLSARPKALGLMALLFFIFGYGSGGAEEFKTFTVKATWKCITQSITDPKYPCRNFSNKVSSFKGGVVLVADDNFRCANESSGNHVTFDMVVNGSRSGKFSCKQNHFNMDVSYKTTFRKSADKISYTIAGKTRTNIGTKDAPVYQTLNFTSKVEIDIFGGKCVGKRSYQFSETLGSVPGGQGRYKFSTPSCVITS